MTHHERTTIADRCARCDSGTPDAQALLAEMRAQLEEARRERDEARQSSEYLHVRWTETAARADGLEDQLADARRERDEAREKARVSELKLRLELADRKNEAASYANAIGRIESVLGMAGSGPLCKTVRAVDDVVKQLADARLSAEQGVKVAESMAAEKAALLTRVGVLEARVVDLEHALPLAVFQKRVAVLEAALDRAIEGFEAVRRSNHKRGHDACDEILPELRRALEGEP